MVGSTAFLYQLSEPRYLSTADGHVDRGRAASQYHRNESRRELEMANGSFSSETRDWTLDGMFGSPRESLGPRWASVGKGKQIKPKFSVPAVNWC